MFHFNCFAGSSTVKFFLASPAIDGTDKLGEPTSDGAHIRHGTLASAKKRIDSILTSVIFLQLNQRGLISGSHLFRRSWKSTRARSHLKKRILVQSTKGGQGSRRSRVLNRRSASGGSGLTRHQSASGGFEIASNQHSAI